MHLVVDHVFEALIIRGTVEYADLQLLPSESTVHDSVTVSCEASLLQPAADLINREITEWGPVTETPSHPCLHPQECFDEVANCHPRRDCMGVHNDVGGETIGGKGHITAVAHHPDYPLLARSG